MVLLKIRTAAGLRNFAILLLEHAIEDLCSLGLVCADPPIEHLQVAMLGLSRLKQLGLALLPAHWNQLTVDLQKIHQNN